MSLNCQGESQGTASDGRLTVQFDVLKITFRHQV